MAEKMKHAEQIDAKPIMWNEEVEAKETTNFWFEEFLSDDHKLTMRLKKLMFDAKSKFQRVQIIETSPFGKTLVLDGKTQSCSMDEFVYHESLVHPALIAHHNPKSVYIGGGGEGATVREVLRHKSVEKCVMVDIDGVAVEQCIEHLPEWFNGGHKDPRCELHYDDAKGWLERYEGTFDVIIMDICDPIEAGPGIALYTKEFYEFATSKLNPGGILVTQSGSCAFHNCDECFTTIHSTLSSCFDHVDGYNTDIPSFGSPWGYNIAYNALGADGKKAAGAGKRKAVEGGDSIKSLSVEEIDSRIATRITDIKKKPLQHYDGSTHHGMFNMQKAVRTKMAAEKRVITVDNPIYMY